MICALFVGISIVDADLTTDVVEPADFNRFVSSLNETNVKLYYVL